MCSDRLQRARGGVAHVRESWGRAEPPEKHPSPPLQRCRCSAFSRGHNALNMWGVSPHRGCFCGELRRK
eukprot:982369-Alexandrium_andersonii.AAC.1